MIFNVYRKKRTKNGKSVIDRNYRGRFRLDGEFEPTDVPLKTPDKQVALQKLRKIVDEREQERAGLIAPKKQRESAERPLLDHLAEFLEDLKTKQRSPVYIKDLKSRFSKVAYDCNWKFYRDIQADHFIEWRSKYKAAPKTLNEYLNAANAFLNWMVRFGRVIENPLRVIEKINTDGKQELRRALTDEEFARLLEVSEDYYLVYQTAVYTGLRLSELMQLIVADVKLHEERPYLIAQASTTKNGKKATVPLHPRLVNEFEAALEGKRAEERVFPQYTQPDRRFRRHLKAAGIERIDAAGRKLVFHSLRNTFATRLARQGVSQRLAQELMRHSDPRLTANIYTDAAHLPTFDAVEKMPWTHALDDKPSPKKSDANDDLLTQADMPDLTFTFMS